MTLSALEGIVRLEYRVKSLNINTHRMLSFTTRNLFLPVGDRVTTLRG